MMRHRIRYTATMDPSTFAKLERETGSINRSRLIEAAVSTFLRYMEEVKTVKERNDPTARSKERSAFR